MLIVEEEGVGESGYLVLLTLRELRGEFVRSQVAGLDVVDEGTQCGAETGAAFGETLEISQGGTVVVLLQFVGRSAQFMSD